MTALYLIRYDHDTPQAVATTSSFVDPSYRELYELGFRPCSKAVYQDAKHKLSEVCKTQEYTRESIV